MSRKPKSLDRYVTLKDVTIPAGSEGTAFLYVRSEKHNYMSVLISHDEDTTSEWLIPVEDALRLGIIQREGDEGKDSP